VSNIAEPGRPAAFLEAARSVGALLLGAGLIAVASSDMPAPLPWAYGLLPLGILWLTRRIGLLLGLLAATATLGAVDAAGVQDPSQLFFIAVLAGSGWSLAACARRGVRASTALALSAAPVLLVAAGYLLFGGLDELTRLVAARIEDLRRLETEHRVSQTLGLSSVEFEQALERTGKVWSLLLPSLFAMKWILVLAINCWLASVLFQDGEGFPSFAEFSTWRLHTAGAWAVALALLLLASRVGPAIEAGVNLAFPLAIAYTIQGFAVARFLSIAFEVKGLVQAAMLILVVLLPILLVVFLGIGFFDSWFDFRRRAVLGLYGPWGHQSDKGE
jgi:Predicted membrane protein (DUF2232)